MNYRASSKQQRRNHNALKSRQRLRSLIFEGLENRELLASDFNLVKDINTVPSLEGSRPHEITTIGNVAYFAATAETVGTELWKTDGTSASIISRTVD